MKKYIFVDVYKKSPTRISKDTNGGYGTENLFGPGFVSFMAQFYLKRNVFWPNLSFAQLYTEFLNSFNSNSCVYISGDLNHCLKMMDDIDFSDQSFVFICSSIVCFETEVNFASNVLKKRWGAQLIPIFCGNAAHSLSNRIPTGSIILEGAYEFLIKQYGIESLEEILKPSKLSPSVVSLKSQAGDSLQPINWNEFPARLSNRLLTSRTIIPYIASRGCPYSCYVYCTYPTSQGRQVFHESADSVVQKLKFQSKRAAGSHVIFRDPVFSISLAYAKDLLKKISDANLGLTFTAELHLKNIDEEFCDLAKNAGFTWFKVGIESSSSSVREHSGRYSVSNDIQVDRIRLAQSYGIKVDGMFILCQPSDTIKSCYKTIDYSIDLGLDMAQFSMFTPYPGTPKFAEFRDSIVEKKFENFSQFDLVYSHPNIERHNARRLLGYAHKKFYLNLIKRKMLGIKH